MRGNNYVEEKRRTTNKLMDKWDNGKLGRTLLVSKEKWLGSSEDENKIVFEHFIVLNKF